MHWIMRLGLSFHLLLPSAPGDGDKQPGSACDSPPLAAMQPQPDRCAEASHELGALQQAWKGGRIIWSGQHRHHLLEKGSLEAWMLPEKRKETVSFWDSACLGTGCSVTGAAGAAKGVPGPGIFCWREGLAQRGCLHGHIRISLRQQEGKQGDTDLCLLMPPALGLMGEADPTL